MFPRIVLCFSIKRVICISWRSTQTLSGRNHRISQFNTNIFLVDNFSVWFSAWIFSSLSQQEGLWWIWSSNLSSQPTFWFNDVKHFALNPLSSWNEKDWIPSVLWLFLCNSLIPWLLANLQSTSIFQCASFISHSLWGLVLTHRYLCI